MNRMRRDGAARPHWRVGLAMTAFCALLATQPAVAREATPAAPEPDAVERSSPLLVSPLARGYRLTSGFGRRNLDIKGASRFHAGVDLAVTKRTVVRAISMGVVKTARRYKGYGLLVTVAHSDGYESRYAHLDGVVVKPGKVVAAGQPLGSVGTTGVTSGPHLHFEFRHKGKALDPAPLMERWASNKAAPARQALRAPRLTAAAPAHPLVARPASDADIAALPTALRQPR